MAGSGRSNYYLIKGVLRPEIVGTHERAATR
ncbi:uncharacterized protein ANIA_11294 [Aspergillus nidulans FGSC A4]|uniref:Uncharacterized protein n=1 Tax=Emericella nidulans (strain FGSC A4 / ATCC 38163 / CBS 112.46 / NRRL 194 / M139) TaxID=227321 RepID=C8VTK1_EMENI|nr:hypothetical protein [Aspergillus nidulans FGSC A4]CBF88147.1 TPA: hypothetical protein ANIA_11294 [Aspergillus nidulans FGSC A4]